MANWKVTFFLSLGKQGWSETYYTTVEGSNAAFLRAKGLANLRNTCLGANVAFEAIRLSDDAVQGDADLSSSNVVTTSTVQKDAVADPPFVANLIRCQSGLSYRRHIYLRGIPDSVVNPKDAEDEVIKGNYLVNLKAFRASLADGTWQLKVIAKGAEAPRFRVIGVTFLEGGETAIKLDGAPEGLVAGETMRLYNVRNVPGGGLYKGLSINRPHRVIRVEAGNVYVIPWATTSDANWVKGGTAKRLRYIFVAIDKAEGLRITHRDTGRPFGATRGRRPARKP